MYPDEWKGEGFLSFLIYDRNSSCDSFSRNNGLHWYHSSLSLNTFSAKPCPFLDWIMDRTDYPLRFHTLIPMFLSQKI